MGISGIFLFGYDTGIGGGVLVLPTFAADFKITGTPQHVADLQGNVVAILQGGAFFGAIIMYVTHLHRESKLIGGLSS